MKKVVSVVFEGNHKKYYFESIPNLKLNNLVVVETIRGVEIGKIVEEEKQIDDSEVVGELRPVIRLTTEDDLKRAKDNKALRPETLKRIKEIVKDFKLDMKVLDLEYTLDKTKLIIYFTADERIDFRASGLVDTYTITYTDGNTSNFAVTNGKDGSVWYKGTALTGTGTSITGFPGNKDDFYLNSSTGIVYVCTATGTAVTATWDYVMTMSGGGGASVLDDLTDVTISSATNGQVLQYDGSKWVNASGSSSSLAGLTDTNITSAADEQFLRYDSGSSKWVNETVTIPDVAVDHNGTASTSAVRKQRIKINSTYYDVDGSVYMEGSANSATFNFSNAAILADSAIDVYTDTWGDNPSNVTSSTGSVTVTFAAAQTRTVRIYIH